MPRALYGGPWRADDVMLRERLRHVHWIGGGSGAGKSTVARRLAARYGMRVYSTDGVMADHAGRSTPETAPYLSASKPRDRHKPRLNRSPEPTQGTIPCFRGEGCDLIPKARRPRPAAPGGNA